MRTTPAQEESAGFPRDVTTRLLTSASYPTAGLTVAALDAKGERGFCRGKERVDQDADVDLDTRYLFGSFTKVLTAALVCQLADDGKLGLDDAARRYLPRVPRSDVTVRQLLSHTAGLADMFHFVENADAVIDHVFATDAIAPPGKLFSYSNAGYVVLGRIVEEVGDASWYTQIERRLLVPLDVESVLAPSDRCEADALGHVYSREQGRLIPQPMWPAVGGALDAAGSRLQGSARDAARLAMGIATGITPGGTRLLEPPVLSEMLKAHAEVPGAGMMARHWCLGWAMLTDQRHRPVYGHMGGTSAIVAAAPEAESACAVLTNFPFGARLGREVLAAYFDVRLPDLSLLSERALPEDARLLEGTYRSNTLLVSVQLDQGRLWMTNPLGGRALPLMALGGRTFCVDLGELATDVTFIGPRGAQPTGIHLGLRLLARSA